MKWNAGMPLLPMFSAAALSVVCLAGCSTVDQTISNILSSDADAAAVFAGHVLQGKANFTGAREATIRLQSDEAPGLGCFGVLHFTGTSAGIASLTCNDGQMVSIPFQSLGPVRGWGRSQVGNAVFSLEYGLQPEMAAPYLGLPVERLAPPKPAPTVAQSNTQ